MLCFHSLIVLSVSNSSCLNLLLKLNGPCCQPSTHYGVSIFSMVLDIQILAINPELLPVNPFEDMEGEILGVIAKSWIFAIELNSFRVLHIGLIYSASS